MKESKNVKRQCEGLPHKFSRLKNSNIFKDIIMTKTISVRELEDLAGFLPQETKPVVFISLSFDIENKELYKIAPESKRAKKEESQLDLGLMKVSFEKDDTIYVWSYNNVIHKCHPSELSDEDVMKKRQNGLAMFQAWFFVVQRHFKELGCTVVEGMISVPTESIVEGAMTLEYLKPTQQIMLEEQKAQQAKATANENAKPAIEEAVKSSIITEDL
jgi:hypothetical protein